MLLPDKLNIGYKPVLLTRESEDKTTGGHYQDSGREMYVSNDVPHDEQALAFLHEMVHLFLAERDIDLDEGVEEQICNAVSRGFAEVLTRNPGLIHTVQVSLES